MEAEEKRKKKKRKEKNKKKINNWGFASLPPYHLPVVQYPFLTNKRPAPL